MDRGVVVGGVLICASFLLAVVLNRSADTPIRPAQSEEPTAIEARCAEDVPEVASKHSAERTPKNDASPPRTRALKASCN
jgi:hypothetical protein